MSTQQRLEALYAEERKLAQAYHGWSAPERLQRIRRQIAMLTEADRQSPPMPELPRKAKW